MFVYICTHIVAVVQSLSHAWLFATPRTVARQAPQSIAFPRKNIGVGFHFLLLYTYMCVCVCVCTLICIYTRQHMCGCVCMCIYMRETAYYSIRVLYIYVKNITIIIKKLMKCSLIRAVIL